MPSKQIKTLELLVIREIHSLNGYNQAVHEAFAKMMRHFEDEEYLYGIEHTAIITTIYINQFYKYKSAEALSRELHIDAKTLLFYRKSYLTLFAKNYLGLRIEKPEDFIALYEQLKNGAKPLKEKEYIGKSE